MGRKIFSVLPVLFLMVAVFGLLSAPYRACADSLSLLTDLKYEIGTTHTKEKATGESYDNERKAFSQLYSLDMQKEFMPNLKLNLGGLFDRDEINTDTTDPDSRDSAVRNTSLRPYLDLQLSTPILRASAGYRKNEIKQTSSIAETRLSFSEEYRAGLNYEPDQWPEFDFDFTRNLAYNEPLTNDQRIDNYQMRSRYQYKNLRFNYSHTTSDALNKVAEFTTLTNTDNGSIRFSRGFLQDRISVNSSLRGSRQAIEFSGTGDRLVPTASAGIVIGSTKDPSPLTSDPEEGFSLDDVDLLVDSVLEAKQFSFGLDFGTATEVDRLYINFADPMNYLSSQFSWSVYVRANETDRWTRVVSVQDSTNLAEKRFELSFLPVATRYIKIVTTPLAPPTVPSGEDLKIVGVVGQRTLSPESSKVVSTDWTGDLSVNVKHTADTSTGYDFLYREQRLQPLDEKKTQMNAGGRLRHRFDNTFVGNLRLQRNESREQDENPNVDTNFSAALTAKYLKTFDQSLTYSYSQQKDEENRIGTSEAVFLRSNVDLYDGWSPYLDNGVSRQHPIDGEDARTSFIRVGSNIVPNRWMNLTLSYGSSWTRETGKAISRDEDGRLVFTLVPTSALSFSADLSFSKDTGDTEETTRNQQYFVNWSPFRDGTLMFSMGYGRSNDTNEEKAWTLSPTLRWKINPKTLLTLDYALGKREDRNDVVDFQNIGLALRFFY